MKIQYQPYKKTSFEDIQVGDIFWHEGDLYMRLCDQYTYNGVKLKDGTLYTFMPVFPCNPARGQFVVEEPRQL